MNLPVVARTSVHLLCFYVVSTGSVFAERFDVGDTVVAKQDTTLKLGQKVVAQVSRGDSLVVEQMKGDWLWVSLGETKGWVYGAHVRAASALGGAEETRSPRGPEDDLAAKVPAMEDALIKSITEKGIQDFFVISDIKPIGKSTLKGKVCIAGRGSLPVTAETSDRVGEGVDLKFISPVSHGSLMNVHQGKAAVIIDGEKVDSNRAMYSVGAVWRLIPRLIDKGKVDPLCGVAFTRGTRLGSLYEGDGNLVFDYVRANKKIIQFPCGTAGSVHRYVGQLEVGDYVFQGGDDPSNVLTFLLTDDGYVYLRGKGGVRLPSGRWVQLGQQ